MRVRHRQQGFTLQATVQGFTLQATVQGFTLQATVLQASVATPVDLCKIQACINQSIAGRVCAPLRAGPGVQPLFRLRRNTFPQNNPRCSGTEA